MPVDTQHCDYERALPDWTTMRDVLAGARAVKKAGTAYLPRLGDQSDPEYTAYSTRAQFFGVTARTAQSLGGFVFRKDPEFTFPDIATVFADDATKTRVSFYDYVKQTVDEVIAVGRAGSLIDYSNDLGAEPRPYVVQYKAEDIINWKVDRIEGASVLTILTLFEYDAKWIPLDPAEQREGPPDEFEEASYAQWRVYRLRPDGAGGHYVTISIYRRKKADKKNRAKASSEDEFVLVQDTAPVRRGQALHRIPFVFHNAEHGLPQCGKIPLLDLADVNLSHFRTSADLENGRHITGLPTPYFFGADDKVTTINLGANTALVSDNPQATCGFLEFKGEGLGALEKAITEKENQMAALGARLLAPEAKQAEAFQTVELRNASENSALMNIAITCGQTLSDVLRWAAWWLGTEADPADLRETTEVNINTDFVSSRMPPDMLTAIVAAYNASAIDFETLFFNLQRGELVGVDMDAETMRGNIEANPPGMAAASAMAKLTAPPEPAPTPGQ